MRVFVSSRIKGHLMAGREPKPEPVSISEWRRYVQRETRRLLQKQEEAVARGEGSAPTLDAATGLPIPPEALHQPAHDVSSMDSAHRMPIHSADHAPRTSDVIAHRPAAPIRLTPSVAPPPKVETKVQHVNLDSLASLESDIQPLTPEVLAEIERERLALAATMPTNRIGPEDEAHLLRQASSPLEAEESNIAEAQVIRAEVQLERRDAYNNRVIQTDAAQIITGQPGMPEGEMALIESAIETITERPTPPSQVPLVAQPAVAVEQPMLFDTEHLARREEEKRRSRGPSPKQKREDLIEELLDPVVSLEEAATILNVCKTTVRRYTNQGLLECIRTPGNQRRFKLSTILNFVDVKDVKGIGKRGRKPKKRDDAAE